MTPQVKSCQYSLLERVTDGQMELQPVFEFRDIIISRLIRILIRGV